MTILKIYEVPYRVKNGGYTEPDMVSSGGSYDIHRYIVITCFSAEAAKRAALTYASRHTQYRVTVGKPFVLGDA